MPQTALPHSVKSVILYLLRYLSPNERTIPANAKYGNSRIEAALEALNGALSEIHTLGPAWIYRNNIGRTVNAPVTLDGTFTTGSNTFTPDSGAWQDWMEGCTVAINGEGTDNQIVGYSPVSGDGTLRDPYLGTGGTVSMTVYHDSIKGGDDVGEIMFPVFWGSDRQLREVSNQGEGLYLSTDYQYFEDYGYDRRVRKGGGLPRNLLQASRNPGTPEFTWVDNFWNEHHVQEKRIRLLPLPNVQQTIQFNAKLEVPQYQLGDVLHNGNGPVIMKAISPTIGEIPVKYDAAVTNVRIFPVQDLAGNTRQAYNFSTILGGSSEATTRLDISALSPAPTTGAQFLVWYEEAAVGTIVEGTILKFPNSLVDSVLKKVAAQHFRMSNFFRNSSVIPEIERGYTEALGLVRAARPQNKNTMRSIPLYYP